MKFGHKKLIQETHVRFLGVLLDSTLSWKYHLTELSKKLARTSGLFYKIRHYVPKDALLLLYHAIFAPFLAYGVSTWGLTYPSLLDHILILQKKIIRIITFNEVTAPSGPLFDILQILKLNDIIFIHIVSFVYECAHNLAPALFNNYFSRIHNVHSIGTRQSKNVTYLLYDVTQPSMGSVLFIILVFVTLILYHLKSEILTPFPIFRRMSKVIY